MKTVMLSDREEYRLTRTDWLLESLLKISFYYFLLWIVVYVFI